MQADFPSVAGLIEELDSQMDTDNISSQGHKEKKYYIDTVNIKIPRKGMEMTGFLRDGMSMFSLSIYRIEFFDILWYFLYITIFLIYRDILRNRFIYLLLHYQNNENKQRKRQTNRSKLTIVS